MLTEVIAAWMMVHSKGMPLTRNMDHLRQYLGLNIEDDTIRIVGDGKGRIKGVCLWKMTTEEAGEPGVWDHSNPDGDILVVYHLVATDKRAVARMAKFLLQKYPNMKEVWGERSGKPKRYSVEFMERLSNG